MVYLLIRCFCYPFLHLKMCTWGCLKFQQTNIESLSNLNVMLEVKADGMKMQTYTEIFYLTQTMLQTFLGGFLILVSKMISSKRNMYMSIHFEISGEKNIKQFKVTQEVTTKKFIFCSKKPFFISSTTKIFHSYHSVLKIIHKICRGKMETQLCPHSYTLSGISLVSSIFSHLLSAAYNFTSSPLQP